MADLKPQNNPEDVELATSEKSPEQQKSPEALLKKLGDGVESMRRIDEKLDAAAVQAKEKRAVKNVTKVAPEKKQKVVVNWSFIIKAYRRTSNLVKKNMHDAVEYLRQKREIVLKYSENRLHKRKKIQAALAATMLFFTL